MKGNNNRPWEGLGGGVYSTYSTRGNHHDLSLRLVRPQLIQSLRDTAQTPCRTSRSFACLPRPH